LNLYLWIRKLLDYGDALARKTNYFHIRINYYIYLIQIDLNVLQCVDVAD